MLEEATARRGQGRNQSRRRHRLGGLALLCSQTWVSGARFGAVMQSVEPNATGVDDTTGRWHSAKTRYRPTRTGVTVRPSARQAAARGPHADDREPSLGGCGTGNTGRVAIISEDGSGYNRLVGLGCWGVGARRCMYEHVRWPSVPRLHHEGCGEAIDMAYSVEKYSIPFLHQFPLHEYLVNTPLDRPVCGAGPRRTLAADCLWPLIWGVQKTAEQKTC
jgi:hypothetical protein